MLFWTNSRALIFMSVILFLAQPSFGEHHFPDYPVRPASEYANKVTKTNLIVAVETVEDQEKQKIYFNSHLSSKGILPVLIVIQNTSSTDTYLVDKSSIGLGEPVEITD